MENQRDNNVRELFPAAGYQLVDDLPSEANDPIFAREEARMPGIDIKDYVDARTDMVRAQNDARFAELITEIRTVGAKLDHVPSTWTMIGTIIAAAVGAVGLVLGILAFAGDRFDGGVAASDLVTKASELQAEKIAAFTEQQVLRDSLQDAKLDQILRAVEFGTRQPPEGQKFENLPPQVPPGHSGFDEKTGKPIPIP